MDKLNPYYLVKDEVELEVKVRGEVPSAGVADLRKQLRSLVRSGRLWSLNYTMKRMRRDFEDCQIKADDLLDQVSDLGLTPDL